MKGSTVKNILCALLVAPVLTAASPAGEPGVTGIKAFYRDGQVFVTWKDAAEGEAGAKYRYSVYRSDAAITQENVSKAEPVIRGILNNSCKLMGMDLTAKDRLDPEKPRIRLSDGGERLPMWSGVGVHTVEKDGKGYYAVVATDLDLKPLSKVVPGQSATTQPVEERVAPLRPIRQFAAEERANQYGKISGKKGLPLYVQLHASCSSKASMAKTGDYFTYFGPSKEYGWRAGQPGVFGLSESTKGQPHLTLAPRDTMNTPGGARGIENLWVGLLCRPNWSSDPVPRAHPFSAKRVAWVIDWVVREYGADPNRICMGGQSMGAWGTFTIGLMHPEIFAALYPTGPMCHQWKLYGCAGGGRVYLRGATPEKNIPAKDLKMTGGKPPMMPDGKTEFFDYLNLMAHVERTHGDLPFACFIGGRQGRKPWAGYAKWENMVTMVRALTRNHHGFAFGWDNRGHGSARKQFQKLKEYYSWEKFALDRSYPAFGNSSIDDDMGLDGPDEGYVNVGFVWKDVVDEEGRWSATISNREAEKDMTVDVTPRRCQKFKPAPGEKLAWTSSAGASGGVTVDQWGLATVGKVEISKGREIVLTLSRGARSPAPAPQPVDRPGGPEPAPGGEPGERPGTPPGPRKSLAGMTVNQLGEYIKKHHGMSDVSLATAMDESAYEVFGNPKDPAAPRLVVSWTADQEGVPIVDQFAFTKAKLPDLGDEEAVADFCRKLLAGKEDK
jgi:hypothetical protein